MSARRWKRRADPLYAVVVWATWFVMTAGVLLALCILLTLAA
jgi:hypothetical protein